MKPRVRKTPKIKRTVSGGPYDGYKLLLTDGCTVCFKVDKWYGYYNNWRWKDL